MKTMLDMTRDEIRAECKALTAGPGKFEGEPIWAPWFYELMMHGDGVDDDHRKVFAVTDEDRAIFPELGDHKMVVLWESDSGFVFAHHGHSVINLQTGETLCTVPGFNEAARVARKAMRRTNVQHSIQAL